MAQAKKDRGETIKQASGFSQKQSNQRLTTLARTGKIIFFVHCRILFSLAGVNLPFGSAET
jgi:hypothetical protein